MTNYNHKADTEARMRLKHLKGNEKGELYIEPVFQYGVSEDTTERVAATLKSITAAFNVIRSEMARVGITENPEFSTQFLIAAKGTRSQFDQISDCPSIRGFQTSIHLKRR